MSFFFRGDAVSFISPPGKDSNKYTRGVAGIVAGSDKFPGAGVLASRAALRSGTGFCRFMGESQFCDTLVLNRSPEMVIGEGRCNSFLIGSGIVDISKDRRQGSIQRIMAGELWWDNSGYLVLDAGGMDLALSHTLPPLTVLTPHSGELSRLLKAKGEDGEVPEILANPVLYAEKASKLFSCAVLLKGTRTIASLGGYSEEVNIDCHYLACAGSGDVLAGFLAGFLALTKPEEGEEFVRACAAAAFFHNLSAKIASKSLTGQGRPIIAGDVADNLPNAYLWATQKGKLD